VEKNPASWHWQLTSRTGGGTTVTQRATNGTPQYTFAVAVKIVLLPILELGVAE